MRSFGASLLLIALLSVAKPIGAGSAYKGTLAADQPFTLNVDNGQFGVGKTTVTVTYYLTTGRPATKFDVHVVSAGAREAFAEVMPRGTRLIAIEVVPPSGATVSVDVLQELAAFTETCVGGCTLTFDLQ